MRRRWVKVLAVVVVVLAGLFVAADRIAVHEVEQYAAKKADQKYNFSNATNSYTDVDIHGFPFLTQAAGRTLDDVTLTAGNMTVDNTAGSQGSYLTIQKLQLEMKDMQVASTFDSVRSGSVSGTVSIRWSDLSASLSRVLHDGHATIAAATDPVNGTRRSTLGVRLAGSVDGRDLPGEAVIRSIGNDMSIEMPGYNDGVPGSAGTNRLSWPLGLPASLGIDGFSATPDALQIHIFGGGVVLGRNTGSTV